MFYITIHSYYSAKEGRAIVFLFIITRPEDELVKLILLLIISLSWKNPCSFSFKLLLFLIFRNVLFFYYRYRISQSNRSVGPCGSLLFCDRSTWRELSPREMCFCTYSVAEFRSEFKPLSL